MSEFRRQQRSYLRQLAFWAETVAKLGEEVTRPPTESESNRGISSWLVRIAPPTSSVRNMPFREMGNHFTNVYRVILHSLPEDK